MARDVSIWVFDDQIIVGNDSTKPGENYFSFPCTAENVVIWCKALMNCLDDGDLQDVPGSMETQVEGVDE